MDERQPISAENPVGLENRRWQRLAPLAIPLLLLCTSLYICAPPTTIKAWQPGEEAITEYSGRQVEIDDATGRVFMYNQLLDAYLDTGFVMWDKTNASGDWINVWWRLGYHHPAIDWLNIDYSDSYGVPDLRIKEK